MPPGNGLKYPLAAGDGKWVEFSMQRHDGGEEEELAGEGRMCLPGVLLHPVKHVDLVFEHEADKR